ncbi:CBS domain-containing protein [Mesonia aestuariivivens]|uniref:CBS domain-containing protein n=1 Tax=Mesonia aestuariivivens TaxID=2796128 RepID=A0ABS6W5K7_9FLAO|nr:CBS domain-containing protein [Mesonia aestuariivivens]MBW2962413.1 CBS domain-containing protein [Mesonia aestuariivivens]
MNITHYIINDVAIQSVTEKIETLKKLFNELTYTHIPISKNGIFMGCIAENDVRCFENNKPLTEYEYSLETFFVRETDNWLDVLETFTNNNTNLMPVLSTEENNYLGYLEISDVLSYFSETPFMDSPGAIVVVEKGLKDYAFSELCQIVESNEGRLLGAFVSNIDNDIAQITIKIGLLGLNEIIQTFRRYSYKVVSTHQEDVFLKNLKERSDYLDKYLNI